MKINILQVHNRYQFPGGEDTVADAERQLLNENGHMVFRFELNNQEIKSYGILKKSLLFFKPTWSFSAKRKVSQILKSKSIDVVHLHNFFPLVSPSILYACAEIRVPVVYTLHNWRIICARGLFYRDGRTCEECMDKSVFSAIKYGCYHSSRAQTASIVLMQIMHRHIKTWESQVNIFIAPTQFVKKKFLKAGIPPARIIVKPHFVHPVQETVSCSEKFALFLGRLAKNKGIIELLKAWKNVDYQLKVVGSGVLEHQVLRFLEEEKLNNVELCGQVTNKQTFAFIKKSSFLIVPSIHYEAFAKVVIEAFSCSKPVIASRRPPLTELIDHGRNGLLFDPEDIVDLVSKIRWLLSHEVELKDMGMQARKDYEHKFTAEENYRQLINIYKNAIQ